MLVYWVVFLTCVLLAVARVRVSAVGWSLIGTALIAFIGLRYQVGGDWVSYLRYLNRVTDEPFYRVFALKDPGFQIVNWVGGRFGFEVWFVNLVAALAFISGLLQFIRTLPDPRIALAVSIPYMVIVMGMGYTRQAMAFGFVAWGLKLLIQQRTMGFVLILAIAAAFHKSAIILIPLAVLADPRNGARSLIWVGPLGVALFLVLLQEHVDTLYSNYVVSEYSDASEGGPIRVIMNALPAVVFLLFRKQFDMTTQEHALWFWVSLLALSCLPLVLVSATAVDRVALYLMPIQLVIASHFPRFFQANGRVVARITVLGLYGTIMFVWLNYAGHREAWIPYQFWPVA